MEECLLYFCTIQCTLAYCTVYKVHYPTNLLVQCRVINFILYMVHFTPNSEKFHTVHCVQRALYTVIRSIMALHCFRLKLCTVNCIVQCSVTLGKQNSVYYSTVYSCILYREKWKDCNVKYSVHYYG